MEHFHNIDGKQVRCLAPVCNDGVEVAPSPSAAERAENILTSTGKALMLWATLPIVGLVFFGMTGLIIGLVIAMLASLGSRRT